MKRYLAYQISFKQASIEKLKLELQSRQISVGNQYKIHTILCKVRTLFNKNPIGKIERSLMSLLIKLTCFLFNIFILALVLSKNKSKLC